ncbi:MAG: DUF1269 domain-containing protein [Myxococcota bacterium]
MASVTVWKFSTPEGAEGALGTLKGLEKEHLVEVLDAAVVSWPEGRKKPKTKQALDLVAAGAFDGAFWGMLFGIIFFAPLFGAAVGAALGALSGSFADFGINDTFIAKIREEVTEGTSALFVMTRAETPARIAQALQGTNIELITSNLGPEQEAELRRVFMTQ